MRLQADAVVIGAGVAPEVTLARTAGLELDEEHGGIACDSELHTSAPGVWAAGDVAAYDSVVHGRRHARGALGCRLQPGQDGRVEHAGRRQAHREVPYFFSDLADWASLEYVGPAREWDEEIVRGSIEEGSFSLWYLKGGRVLGALSVGRSEDLDPARRLIAAGVAAR